MPSPIRNLNIASSAEIVAALSRLKGTFNGINGWQNVANNKYIVDTVDELKRDFRANSINNSNIVDYIATSVCIHCFNGWSYLSTAINSLIEGDYGNAIHNAYYAELRGISSILASQGIGVFNGSNVLIDAAGQAHEVQPSGIRTHSFAKQAFDEWFNNTSNTQTLFSAFIVENNSLKDWLDATGFATDVAGRLAANWLQDWSIDLSIVDTEQKLRNFVSYNPQNFDLSITRGADNIRDRLKFVVEIWKLCSPTGLFSDSILRNTYESLYYNLFNMPLTDLDDEADLNRILVDLGKDPSDNRSTFIKRFLKREIESVNNVVFDYASSMRYSIPVLENDTDPMGIISRACLILMTNVKIVETILRQSGVSKNDLQFWSDNIGIKHGYWDLNAQPYLITDLWGDVELEIEQIEYWINNPQNVFTPYSFKNNLNRSVFHMRSLGKACLWGVGL